MQRLIPHCFISAIVAGTWLVLAHQLDTYNIVVACLLGLIIPKVTDPFLAHVPQVRWQGTIQLFFTVLWDIIISNFVVAKLVLGSKENLSPKWFRVPLDTQNEQVNALLAMIITTTPGTVSAGIDQERGDILVHALSTQNPDIDIQMIKNRYEKPLIHIFNAHLEGQKK